MDRRRLLHSSGTILAVTLAGCSDSTESNAGTETESTSDDDAGDDTEDTETAEETAEVEITDVDVADTVEVDHELHTVVALETPSAVTLSATVALEGETLGEDSTEVDADTDADVILEPEIDSDAPRGEATVRIVAETDDGSDETTEPVEIDDGLTTDQRVMENHIDEAIKTLKSGLKEYGERAEYDGEDASLRHIYPSMEIDANRADDAFEDAHDSIGSALSRTDGDDEWDRVRNLRNNAHALETLLLCQELIYAAYERAESEWEAWDDDRATFWIDRDDLEEAETLYADVEADLNADFEWVDSKFEAVDDHIGWQLEQLETTYRAIESMWHAVDEDEAKPELFEVAKEDFEEVKDELREERSRSPEDVTDEVFLDLLEEWADEADIRYRMS